VRAEGDLEVECEVGRDLEGLSEEDILDWPHSPELVWDAILRTPCSPARDTNIEVEMGERGAAVLPERAEEASK
jgi:hypothetical protein